MSRYPNSTPFKGILRVTDRNILQPSQQRTTAYDSQQMNSQDREINYSSVNEANMPIFPDVESSIPSSSFKSGAKSLNINADLYTQAIAAKSNLGLLDTTFSSSLTALQDYGNYLTLSPSAASQNKFLTSSFQSKMSHNILPNSPASHSSIDLQNETPSSYKNTSIRNNSDLNTEQFIPFKSVMDLNLNTVEEEDEFLYGDTNPLPGISFNQTVDFDTQTNSMDAYMSDDELQGIEAPNLGAPPNSVGEKLNISEWKKASRCGINDTINSCVNINTMKPCEKEPSPFSKRNRVDSETRYHNPLKQNRDDYNTLKMLYYKSREQMRQSQFPETSNELSKATPAELLTTFASYATNNCLSPPKFFSFLSENKSMHMASSNILKNQSNNNRIARKESVYQNIVNYDNVSIEDKNIHSNVNEETDRETMNKSASDKLVNFPKLLVNVEQDRISTKRIVHLKESSNIIVSSPSKFENQPSSYSNDRMENFKSINEVFQSKTIETQKVACNESKNNLTQTAIIDLEDETGSVIPNDGIYPVSRHSMETSRKEQIPKVVPVTYSVKLGEKSYKHWSPERYMSPSYGSRGRSPESTKRRSPSHRYRPRDHSPYYRYHSHSHLYRSHWDSSKRRLRDHSPRYRSRESSGRRSPGHSSRSRERSPRRRNRYHSRGRSPRHSSLEKRSYSPEDRSPLQYPSSETRYRHKDNASPETLTKSVLKRPRAYSSDELSDDECKNSTACKITTSMDENLVECIGHLSETSYKNSDEIASKSRKIDDPEGILQNSLHSNESNMNIKVISNSSITVQNLNESGVLQDPSEANVCLSTNERDLNVITTSWTDITRPPVSISTSSQLDIQNTLQYGMMYPQQSTPVLPHMYPQYMYKTPVPSLTPNIIYNPTIPPPVSVTASFTYPSVPTSTFNVPNNSKLNPHKARVSFLKTVPVVDSIKNVDLFKSKPSKSPPPKDTLSLSENKSPETFQRNVLKNKALHMQKNNSKEEKQLVQRYKTLLEERDIMLKKLRNTSDHTVEIRNLKQELEKKVKTSRAIADKMLIRICANAFEKANDKLNIFIAEAKRLNVNVKELQSKIRPEILEKIVVNPENIEKQVEYPLISYTCFDGGDHWCEECNETFSSIQKMIEHLHKEKHLQHEDPFKLVTTEPVKENIDKNAKLESAKGVEFIKPLYGFYCSLCKEPLVNQSYAEQHLKGTVHLINYKNFLKENPVYEEKRIVFKKAGAIALIQEKRQKNLKEASLSKCLIQEKQKCDAALKKDELQEKVFEESEESNINLQNQKGVGIKLKLTNEKNKSLETKAIKVPDVKPKQTVVYIGRAPNFKPRNKNIDKNNFLEKKKKDTVDKTEEEYDFDSLDTVSEKSKKQFSAVLQPLDTVSFDSKNLDSDPISKISVNPKGIKENKARDNSYGENSTENKLDVTSSNYKTKQSVSLKKNKTVVTGCLSEAEAKKSDSESASKKSDMNEALKNTNNEINISPNNVNLLEIKLTKLPLKTSFPDRNIEIPKLPLKPKRHLTEEEKDFLLLGINKSDMEPIAVPKPPPSALIHNHSDVAKLPPFPPPLQVPPPSIVRQVPPTIAPLIPPPNIISNVPPPNIASQIPPPNIASQVPPPNIASKFSSPNVVLPTNNFTSEQKQQMNPVSSTETSILSLKICPSASKQLQAFIPLENQNTDVVDMEIDDSVISEIKFGSDYLIEKEGIPCSVKSSENMSTSTQSTIVPIIKELPALSLSSITLITNEFKTSPISTVATIISDGKETVKQKLKSTTPRQENGNDSCTAVIDYSNVDDKKIILKELLNSLMDAATDKLEGSEEGEGVSKNKVEASVLSPGKTTESSDLKNKQPGSNCIEPDREDFKRADSPKNFFTMQKIVKDDKFEVGNGNFIENCYNTNQKLSDDSSNDQNDNSDVLMNEKCEENAKNVTSETISSKEVETFTLSLNTSEEILELSREILTTVTMMTSDKPNHSFTHINHFDQSEQSTLCIDGVNSTTEEWNEMDIYVEKCINQKLSDCSSNFQNSYCEAKEKLEDAENSHQELSECASSFSNFMIPLRNEKPKNERNSNKKHDCSSSFQSNISNYLVNKDSENVEHSKNTSSEVTCLKVSETVQSSQVSSPPISSTSFRSENKLVENKEVDDDLEIIAEYNFCHKSDVKSRKKQHRFVPEIIELDSESEEMEIKEVEENSKSIPYVNFSPISEINNDEKQTLSSKNVCQRSIIKKHISVFKETETNTSASTPNEEKKMHASQKAYNTFKKNENFDKKTQKSFASVHDTTCNLQSSKFESKNPETKLIAELKSNECEYIENEIASLASNIHIGIEKSSENTQEISNCVSIRTSENMDCDDILPAEVDCTIDTKSDNLFSVEINTDVTTDHNLSEHPSERLAQSATSKIPTDLGNNVCDIFRKGLANSAGRNDSNILPSSTDHESLNIEEPSSILHIEKTEDIFVSKDTNQILRDNNESVLNSNVASQNEEPLTEITCQENVIARMNVFPQRDSSITYINAQFELNCSGNLCIKQENITPCPCDPENENHSKCISRMDIRVPKSSKMTLMKNDGLVSTPELSNTDKKMQHAHIEISSNDGMHYHDELSSMKNPESSSLVTTYNENIKFAIKKEKEGSDEEIIRNEVVMHSHFRESEERRTEAQENKTSSYNNVSSKPLPFIKVGIKSEEEEKAETIMNKTTETGGYIPASHFPMKIEIKEEKNDSCIEFFDKSMQQNLTHTHERGLMFVEQNRLQENSSHMDESNALEILNQNSQVLKNEILSVPLLKKYDTDDILSDISTDGPPILSEHDESSSQQYRKKREKGEDGIYEML